MSDKPKRHRHEQSTWVLGAYVMWCYQCGAFRFANLGGRWQKPSGIGGPNPVMSKGHKP